MSQPKTPEGAATLLTRKTARLRSLELETETVRNEWNALVFDSNRAGLTYEQVAKATGRSRERIAQVIRMEADRRKAPTTIKEKKHARV